MIRGVAFVILGLIVSCAGFASPPTARRWLPNAGRGALKNTCRTHCMSIREMIGGDVESGGLFDPLGERDIYSLDINMCVDDDVRNVTSRNVICVLGFSGNSKSWLHEQQEDDEVPRTDRVPRGAVYQQLEFDALLLLLILVSLHLTDL